MNKNIKLFSLTVCLLLTNLVIADDKNFVHPDIKKNTENKNIVQPINVNNNLNTQSQNVGSLDDSLKQLQITNEPNKITQNEVLKNSKDKNLEIKKLELKVIELNHKILELQNMTSILIEKIDNNVNNIKVIDKVSKNEIDINELKQNNFNNFKNKNVQNFVGQENSVNSVNSETDSIKEKSFDIKEKNELTKKRDTKSNISVPEEQRVNLASNNIIEKQQVKENKKTKNKIEKIETRIEAEKDVDSIKKVEESKDETVLKEQKTQEEVKQNQEELIKKLKEDKTEKPKTSEDNKIEKTKSQSIMNGNLEFSKNETLMIGNKESNVIIFKDTKLKTIKDGEKNYINDNLLIYKTVVDKGNSTIKTQDKQIKNVFIRNEKNEKIGSIINGTPIDYEEYNETYFKIKNKFYVK